MAAERLLPQLLSDLARLRTAPEAGMPAWATVAARLADGSILDLLASGAGATGATDAKVKVDLEDLRSQVSNLSKTVAEQNAVIKKLPKRK